MSNLKMDNDDFATRLLQVTDSVLVTARDFSDLVTGPALIALAVVGAAIGVVERNPEPFVAGVFCLIARELLQRPAMISGDSDPALD